MAYGTLLVLWEGPQCRLGLPRWLALGPRPSWGVAMPGLPAVTSLCPSPAVPSVKAVTLGGFCTQGDFSGPSLAAERGPQSFAGGWGWRQGPMSAGWGCASVVVCPPPWPRPALRACLLPASPPFFPGTCRRFRRQSQGAEEGRASAHIVLQGGLRGPGPQVARLEGRHTPRPWPHFLGRPGCGFPGALGGGAEVISPFSSSEGTLPRVSLLLDTFPPETPLGLFSPKHLRGALCLPG